MQCHFRYS